MVSTGRSIKLGWVLTGGHKSHLRVPFFLSSELSEHGMPTVSHFTSDFDP